MSKGATEPSLLFVLGEIMEIRITARPRLSVLASRYASFGSSNALPKVLKKIAEEGYQSVRHTTPEKTGRLVRGMTLVKHSKLEYRVIENVPYGQWVRFGAAPHPIPLTGITPMSWPDMDYPPVVWKVRHPGISSPRDYVDIGLKRATPAMEREAGTIGKAVVVHTHGGI